MNRVHVGLIALLGAVALAAPGLAQTGDNVACYTVRDRAKRGAFTLTVTNAGVTQSCRVTMPARLGCLATQVSNVVPTPPGDGPSPGATADLLCYLLVCPRPFPRTPLATANRRTRHVRRRIHLLDRHPRRGGG